MSGNSVSTDNTLFFTSASDMTPPVIDLSSSLDDSSIMILDNSAASEDTLLAGGDTNRNPFPSEITPMKNNSNDFIRNEIVTSTPAVVKREETRRSDGKRKRAESPEMIDIDDDSGEYSPETTNSEDDTKPDVDVSSRSDVKPDVDIVPSVDRSAANYDAATDVVMPDTVTVLTTPSGARVYLVGTAHFSTESQDDVSLVVRAVQPSMVCIELCAARSSVLELDESVLEDASTMDLTKIRAIIRRHGIVNGIVQALLLNLSAHLTRELGMVPGGEFRRAVAEVRRLTHPCVVHLCDRPIGVTVKRALHALSWWQSVKVAWHLLTTNETISKEDVERCKQRDLLEEMLKEMCGDFPEISAVFVDERDLYLAYSLQLAAELRQPANPEIAPRIVAVVGMGHVPGIVRNFGAVTQQAVATVSCVPPPTLASRVTKVVVKATLVGGVVYLTYRLFPRGLLRAIVQ